MVWSELSRDTQRNIMTRSHTESVDTLAAEFSLLPQSLRRKLRKLKALGIINIVQTPKEKIEEKVIKPVAQSAAKQSFVDMMLGYSKTGQMTSDSGDIRIVGADKPPMDRTAYMNPNKEWSGIFFTDTHCPYEDQPSIDALVRVLKILDHNVVIHGGDNLDLYGLSTFAKDNQMMFQNNFAREVEAHNVMLDKIGEASDKIKLSLYGNHMVRYDKWLSNNPFVALDHSMMDRLSLDSILNMKDKGWFPFVGALMISESMDGTYPKPSLVIEHGARVKTGAVKSAMAQFSAYSACSFFQGHVHRLGVGYKRTLHGQHVMAEGGTMRTLNPDYMRYPDWTNGFLHFYAHKDVVTATPIFINNGVAYIGGTKI